MKRTGAEEEDNEITSQVLDAYAQKLKEISTHNFVGQISVPVIKISLPPPVVMTREMDNEFVQLLIQSIKSVQIGQQNFVNIAIVGGKF